MSRPGRRADLLVFSLVLLGVGYFHQGGGWNQNSRFALVRAIVDDGTFAIDDELVYQKDPADPSRLVRVPVRSGDVQLGKEENALAWHGSSGLVPIDVAAAGSRKFESAENVAGHFHPNKAPG